MAFPDQLKKLMGERNMKAVDVARATGLSEAAISDYLKGKKEPRGRQSIALAKALNISLDMLWETDFSISNDVETSPIFKNNAVLSELFEICKEFSEDEQLYILDVAKSLRTRLGKNK